ncbi:hypothetical protein EI982_02980 [Haloplanus rallus]|uniref:Uncharacterized protein n=1 Tax=Haloplanus rallus TaxID=1816183 RepID=A0A6B9F649_9EURY|nr:hypothetical protein [Haloplanus rallus]QGX93821.1 hypothetical protein EI982_02980 [Haloplanus rallus]
MRLPVPNDRLVAFTLVGALLTTLVAGGLAFPGLGLGQPSEPVGDDTSGSPQAGADAPTPNQGFTPAVRTQSGDVEDHESEEHEEEEHEGEEYEGEEYEGEEYEGEEYEGEEYEGEEYEGEEYGDDEEDDDEKDEAG